MRRIIEILLYMIYSALFSAFIFIFTDAFIEWSSLEVSQFILAILAIPFGLNFLIGFGMNIIYSLKHSKE